MTRMVVTDYNFADLAPERAAAEKVGADFEVFQCTREDDVTAAVTGADVALVAFARIGKEQLEAMAPGATIIRYGVGVDSIDLEAARRLGVAVANIPDYGIDTVADHAASLILALLRRLPLYSQGILSEQWVTPTSVGPVPAFSDSTVGLVGAGRIACSLADRLRPFGFRLIAHDPYADPGVVAQHGVELVDLKTLAGECHGLSLHAPLTPDTRHLIGRDFLGQVRRGCVLVNTSRGGLIDEVALAAALADGRVGGAGLDVFEPEPLDPQSPLRGARNIIFSPHAAFYSEASLRNLQRLAAEEAIRAVRGEDLRCPVV